MKKQISKKLLCLLTVILSGFSGFGQIPATANEVLFKDWNYSSSGVFGLVKLVNPEQRKYYKIFKTNNETAKIQEYNAAGMLMNSTLIRYVNGKLNQMTFTNRWGDTYEITKFTVAGPDEFIVTKKNTGENPYLPCKGARYIYRNNQLAEIRYISYANKVTTNSSGVAIIKYKRYTDKNRFSLLKEMAFYDADSKPVISTSYDCHKVIYEYDESGNQVSIAYYGTDNEPLTNRYGGFKGRNHYDENDKLISSETIGINDEITNNAYGVARTTNEYRNGFLSGSTRFNDRGNIAKASDAGDGIAIISYKYDANGNEISRSYFDEKNDPMNNHSGFHKALYTYDSRDMLTSTAYYDRDGAPAADRKGIYKYVYVKDDKGRTIELSYFDKSNEPVQDDGDEVYMVKYKYDEWGRVVSRSFWKNSNTKMNRWNGAHENISKYNSEGRVIETLILDQSGNQFITKSGYSRTVTGYNTEARVSEYKYFNNDLPASLDSGFTNKFHAVKFYYDANGRLASLKYFDKDGQPVNAFIDMEDGFECHKVEFVYKGNTIVEEKIYLKNSDAPSRVIDCLKNDYISTSGVSKGYKNR